MNDTIPEMHIVMFSGGIGSWAAARRVIDRYGPEPVRLFFCDTAMEDADLYRFVRESSQRLGAQLVRARDGRTPWQVFRDVRFLGNTRVDPCSRILKREPAHKWIRTHYPQAIVYLGLDWTEEHRLERARRYWECPVFAPMTEPPYMEKAEMIAWAATEGIRPPRLYDLGFPHNNCGGFCVKAGQTHFSHLLKTLPERYAWHEEQEEQLRQHLGKNVAILRDRRGGKVTPLTMRALRCRIERGNAAPEDEWGGCGCFSDCEEAG